MRNKDLKNWKFVGVLFALVFSINVQASLIFEFDNDSIEAFDFVGVEATDFGISFGPDTFDMGDAFDILIGSTPGASDISTLFNLSASFDGIQGIGFGSTLNIIPVTDLFYVTIVKQAGSFSTASMRAYFSSNGNGYLFHGLPVRQSLSTVPEPTTMFMFLTLFVVFLLLVKNRGIDNPKCHPPS